MSQWDPPARGALAIASPRPGRREPRAVLLWRGAAGSVALALNSMTGFVAAVLALAPLVGRRPAGRRVLGASAPDANTEADRQALPG